jgi:DNA-binding transcriptional MerR regulator
MMTTTTTNNPSNEDSAPQEPGAEQVHAETEESSRAIEVPDNAGSSVDISLDRQSDDEEGDAKHQLHFELSGFDFAPSPATFEAPAQAASVSSDAEELSMIQAPAIEKRVEAGTELIDSIEAIPEKMAFKIGEAAEMVGVKQYVLRYWETEFEMLRPRKSKNGQRVYSRKDVQTAMMIKKLLYEDRFSIEGARTALRQLKNQVKEERGIKVMAQSQETAVAKLRGLVSEIRRIQQIFS